MRGWGLLLWEEGADANGEKCVGGRMPVTLPFALQTAIDRDQARSQAMVNGLLWASRWVAGQSQKRSTVASNPKSVAFFGYSAKPEYLTAPGCRMTEVAGASHDPVEALRALAEAIGARNRSRP